MSIMLANFGKYAISDCPFISTVGIVCALMDDTLDHDFHAIAKMELL